MGIFDRFHGHHENDSGISPMPAIGPTDREAIAQYRSLLRSAPPETIEQAHASAFVQLTQAQRQTILAELCHEMPAFEWETGARYAAEPRSLARMATRAELEHPGTLERVLPRLDLPPGENRTSGFAGMLVGSWAASQFFAETAHTKRATAPIDGGEDITPILGHDVVIDEQTKQYTQAWRQFDDGYS
ncbi:MAG: hypothetical protein ACRDJH_20435 [Thermomicrobiales bacterium]